jgi:hypothetical protein
MRAIGIVQTPIRNHQVIQYLAPHNRFGYDSRDIRDRHPAVPDALRIDHDCWTVFALLEAACVIRSTQQTETSVVQLILERLAQRLTAFGITAAAAMACIANVAANEDVVCERGHDCSS